MAFSIRSSGPSVLFGAVILTTLLLVSCTSAQFSIVEKRSSNVEPGVNGTSFVWTIDDIYEGGTFFDTFDFFTGHDPTNGTVNYTTAEFAFANHLAYVTDDNKVIMKGDNTTWLAPGVFRDSVRISSQKQYNTGLFILDLNKAPWGCAVWPAWWTLGGGLWPYTGEIDIIEGVHDNEHNQVAWHTAPGCYLTPNTNFTGSLVNGSNGQPILDCNGLINDNSGCPVTEWSRASYGPQFDASGGGVFAMKWDELGIAVWSFYRAAVPKDIGDGLPAPSSWGPPVAFLDPSGCNPITNFVNHSIIFDITFCGDWAGNSYASSGCPGTCAERLQNPGNFDDAIWIINSMKVYKKVNVTLPHNGASIIQGPTVLHTWWFPVLAIVITAALVGA